MDIWHTFESLLAELPAAQTALADTVRALVYKADAPLFDRLDFEDDHTFLEPTLFAYFTAADPPATLEQLLFSYVAAHDRPGTVRAYADSTGLVHLPRVGRVQTSMHAALCDLRWDQPAEQFLADDRDEPAAIASPVIDLSGIQVDDVVDPLFRRFFDTHWSRPECRVFPLDAATHRPAVARALATMRRHTPALYEALCAVTRQVVLYRADQPNSFASLSLHGAAFLNVPADCEEVFFADDLAHQCGHMMFNALTQEKDRFLARSATTPLREICEDQHDPRTLYSAFHGLFTYSTILWILQSYETGGHSSDRQRHDALGRIGFNLNKFALDLESLAAPGLFTDDGRAIYELFAAVYDAIFGAYGRTVRELDLSDQPYVFDYARFAARNPLPQSFGRPPQQAGNAA
jgi:HEXXH motif-containing protein